MDAVKMIAAVLTVARTGARGGGRGDPVSMPVGEASRLLAAGEIAVPDLDERAEVEAYQPPAPVDPVVTENTKADPAGVETATAGRAKGKGGK